MTVKTKYEKKQKTIVRFLLASLVAFSVAPYFNAQAQAKYTCNPEKLKPVKLGQRGNDVKNAQACLIEAGYDIPTGATGYYGKQTANAVKEFYKDELNMNWSKSLGRNGIAKLKKILGVALKKEEAPKPATTTGGISPEKLQEVSNLLSQGKTADAIALLMSLLAQQGATPTVTLQQPTPEGFLIVEQDPSATGVIVREGETTNVFGLKFKADKTPITVKSVFLRWIGNFDPYRVISNLSLVDSQGNTLYSTNVNPSTFYRDSSSNYYLPITDLNINVPVNQYTSVFVKVTVVSALPSGVNSVGFQVLQNDVKAVDGAGVNRFGPTSIISATFTLQTPLAQSADFIVARNPGTPKGGYIFGNAPYGRADDVKLLSFNITAKNDKIKLTEVTVYLGNISSISLLDIRYGNQILDVKLPSTTVTFNIAPFNFIIDKDQTVTFDIVADFQKEISTPDANIDVIVTTVKGQNSLGGMVTKSDAVASELFHYRTLGPFEVKIFGDSDCIFKINQALNLLKEKTKDYYDIVIKYIDRIECVEKGTGANSWESPPRVLIGKETVNTNVFWLAGVLVHEAWHVKLYNDYLFKNPLATNVPLEVYSGRNAELESLYPQRDVLIKINAPQNEIDYINNLINNIDNIRYWEIDYSQRWW